MRTPNGHFPEYHTSADNLEFVRPSLLAESFAVARDIVSLLESNTSYVNQNPKCEPQLGKRGLYRSIGAWRVLSMSSHCYGFLTYQTAIIACSISQSARGVHSTRSHRRPMLCWNIICSSPSYYHKATTRGRLTRRNNECDLFRLHS
jgi:Domain of unknown function (DUF4910)/winged helix-turn-helix